MVDVIAESPEGGTDNAPALDRSQRWRELLDLLAERGRLNVTETASTLGVSEATVRRDFGELARQQLATRTHGGVVATAVAYDLPARYRASSDDGGPKARIAARVVELGGPGVVVGFNGGTTTTETARRMAAELRAGVASGEPALTVVTNALNIATEMVLRPHVRTVLLGGVARPQSYEMIGPLAEIVLAELWLDVLVLGVDGLVADGGATCRHVGEAGINARMVERSSRVVVVATGEKIGERAFARICGPQRVSDLVTDESAPTAELGALRDAGVAVHVA